MMLQCCPKFSSWYWQCSLCLQFLQCYCRDAFDKSEHRLKLPNLDLPAEVSPQPLAVQRFEIHYCHEAPYATAALLLAYT